MKTMDVRSLARAMAESMATLHPSQMPALAEAALEILRKNGRSRDIALLPRLLRRMAKRYGPLEVTLESAFSLTDTERVHLESLIKKFSPRLVVIESREDASLIGGLRLRVGDERFDYSVRSVLKRIAPTFTTSH